MTSSRVLHQVLSDDPRAWSDCLDVFRKGDEVLLADQGVQVLGVTGFLAERLGNLGYAVQISALATDILERGLENFVDPYPVKLVDDSQWVNKVCQFDQVLSWK